MNSQSLADALKELLMSLYDKDAGKTLGQLNAVKQVDINNNHCKIGLHFNYKQQTSQQALVNEIKHQIDNSPVKKLMGEAAISKVDIEIENVVQSHEVKNTDAKIPGVKNVIAIGSGKGGVGKSTVSANLACALALEGANVAILDADIYGPSQPRMMGVSGKPVSEDGKSMLPLTAHVSDNNVIAINSIGFLIEEDTPMIWRGAMVTQALMQLALETHWNAHLRGNTGNDEIDYLIIDLPPGTGDIQLTMAQKIPVTAAVIVTTPQDIALLDARKAYQMFNKVKIPVLGIIENMASFQCPNCNHVSHIFGEKGGQTMAETFNTEVLSQVPLDIAIRQQADEGVASVVAQPDLPSSEIYRQTAKKISARLSAFKKNYRDLFPGIQMGGVKTGGDKPAGIAVTKVGKSK